MPGKHNKSEPDDDIKIDFFRQTHPDSARDIDFGIWALLNQSRDAVLRARENELHQYGVTTKEADALLHIFNLDNISPADISRLLFREHSTTSALLARMEKKGLIVKTRDKEKKNMWRVSITEKGRDAYYNSLKRKSLRIIMSTFTEDEKKQIFSFIKKMRDNALLQLISMPTIPFPEPT
jgi:DNA-binding MarR family transcriptional regulator